MTRPLILIADGDSATVAALTRFLRLEGFECVAAGTGADALSALETRPVAALVLDAGLQAPPAAEIVERLDAHPAGAQLPVFVLADYPEEGRAVVGDHAGEVVVRPFHLSVVAARLHKVVPGTEPSQG